MVLSQSLNALTLIRYERRDVVLSQSPGVTEKMVVDIDRFFFFQEDIGLY